MRIYRMSVDVIKYAHTKTNQVTANSKSVITPRPVRALVPRLKCRKLLVRGCGKVLWELMVILAGVDEQRRFAPVDVSLRRIVSRYITASLNGSHRGRPRA